VNVSKGMIVRAAAGRDCGGLFAVVGIDGNYCFIADGKSRKLSSPKRKSFRHIIITEKYADLSNMTDKKLKRLLSEYSDELT